MITEKDILKTANLAKLEISDMDIPLLVNEINKFLSIMDDLDVNAEDFQMPQNAADYKNLREDKLKPSLSSDEILSNTKDTEDGFLSLGKKA